MATHLQGSLFDQTDELRLGSLGGADLVHLACHCVLRADNPAFSALRLGDGPLSVHEIDLRGLAPRRVVLAACDSAADVAYEGDEMLGFVSALLARGTTALVASVVPVPDLDAVPLMVALHEQLGRGVAVGPALHAARAALNGHYATELGEPFTTAGLCYYRDGRDSVAWHGDTIGRSRTEDTMVAILSLGETRRLSLRPRQGVGGSSVSFPVGHGDLLVMGGSCQRTWEHAVPKTAQPVGPRISIQFRPRDVS
jgi:hypothetical protein